MNVWILSFTVCRHNIYTFTEELKVSEVGGFSVNPLFLV